MKVTHTIADCRAARAEMGRIALVPTMGALHEGHLSLIAEARKHVDQVVVSIFVNPTQFGPKEDFRRYPRPLDRDLALCGEAGVSMVFNPAPEEMYPADAPDIVVDLPSLTTLLEGRHRPGHFRGVCQVVGKLFNIVRPQVACFGRKDFQQLRVIEAMVTAMDWPITIVGCPTKRDPDGLAMSSRNMYLTSEDRARALSIPRALQAARDEYQRGVTQTNRLTTTIQKILLEQHLSIDYVAAVNPATLQPADNADDGTLIAIAARVGTTRLIDNTLIGQ